MFSDSQKYCEHIDGDPLEGKPPVLIELMIEKGLIKQTSDNAKLGFCGVIYASEKVHFFWPKTSTLLKDEKAVYSYGRKVLGTLKKYSMNSNQDSYAHGESEEVEGIAPIVALELLQDFIGYGLYTNTTAEVVRRQTGNIDWNRVLRDVPFPDSKGQPIYPDLYVRRPNYFAENEISQIHAAVIAELDHIFGWYFSDDGKSAPTLENARMPCTISRAISLLKKELLKLFSDREIRLIRNLIQILERRNSSEISGFVFSGIRNFEHVWEEMCGYAYKNQKAEFIGYIPTPAYVIKKNEIPSQVNRQRMDIILREENKIVVLDAKYYDISVTQPQWSDLVKQFYYARSLSAIFTECHISNYFLCPQPVTDGADLPDEVIVLNPTNLTRMDDEFKPIKLRYHNVQEMMIFYLESYPTSDYRAHLFK